MNLTHIFFTILIGLTATTTTHGMNTFTIEDNLDSEITLVSCDGQQFRISVKKANHLITVRHLIEDNGVNELIPLLNVTGMTLGHVIEALSHLEDQDAAPLADNETPKPEHVKSLLEKFKDLQPAQIKELFITANYVDFQALMHATGALFGKWLMTTEWDFTDPMFQGITNALGLFIIDRLFEYVHIVAPNATTECKQLGNAMIAAHLTKQKLTFKQYLTCIQVIKGLIKKENIPTLEKDYIIACTPFGITADIFDVTRFGTCSLVTLYCNEAQKAGTLLQLLNAKAFWDKPILMAAVESGNLEIVRFIFEQLKALKIEQQHLNAKDKSNKSVLMEAIESRNLKVVIFILKQLKTLNIHQPHLEAKDTFNQTVLMYAARPGNLQQPGNLKIVTFIFDQLKALKIEQQNLDAKDKDNQTVFMYAAQSGNLELVTFIFEQLKALKIEQQHLDATNTFNEIVLMAAAQSGNVDVVAFIFEQLKALKIEHQHLDATDMFNETVLTWAAHNRNNPKYTAVADYLLDHDAEAKKRDREEEEQQEHNKRQKREDNNDENK